MRDARDRATTLATEAGVTLGEVVRIAEQPAADDQRPIAGRMALRAAAEAVPTPVEVGEQEVTVNLAVVFAVA